MNDGLVVHDSVRKTKHGIIEQRLLGALLLTVSAEWQVTTDQHQQRRCFTHTHIHSQTKHAKLASSYERLG